VKKPEVRSIHLELRQFHHNGVHQNCPMRRCWRVAICSRIVTVAEFDVRKLLNSLSRVDCCWTAFWIDSGVASAELVAAARTAPIASMFVAVRSVASVRSVHSVCFVPCITALVYKHGQFGRAYDDEQELEALPMMNKMLVLDWIWLKIQRRGHQYRGSE
jgi:hypothetical protein